MTQEADTTAKMQAIGTSAIRRASSSNLRPPISCLIGILKPSGCTSMSMLDTLKPLLAQSKLFQVPVNKDLQKQRWKSKTKRNRDNDRFTTNSDGSSSMAPKIGQGGTLDPLADGVLVLGIGAGTKRLQQFLDCTKEYKAIGLLGTSTLSYDADEPILLRRPYDHVTSEVIEEALPSFRGKVKQMPPLYSAIHIDGMRLFEYARQGKDLPRPVEKRNVEITDLQLIEWNEGGQHSYKEPEKECDEEERRVALRARLLAGMDPVENTSVSESKRGTEAEGNTDVGDKAGTEKSTPPTFTLQMTVSSGTYVRSVIHDVGLQVKSAAHVVRLSRTRQGDWISPEYRLKEGEDKAKLKKAIPWEPLLNAARALQERNKGKRQKIGDGMEAGANGTEEDDEDDDKLSEWEQLLVDHLQLVEV
jgi:tRNA pseudouridine55 synthase